MQRSRRNSIFTQPTGALGCGGCESTMLTSSQRPRRFRTAGRTDFKYSGTATITQYIGYDGCAMTGTTRTAACARYDSRDGTIETIGRAEGQPINTAYDSLTRESNNSTATLGNSADASTTEYCRGVPQEFSQTFTYDAWNQLVAVKNSAGVVIAQYTYDARGYRISETYPQGGTGIPAGTTNYIYYDAQWQAIETRTNGTANTNVTSQMVWSASYINAAVVQDTYSAGVAQPNSRLCFEQDANWDTTAVVGYNATSGTWNVVQRYTYSPYGTITVLNADWSTPPTGTQPLVDNLYQGMTLDPVTGLYYERNRNYSPSLGTWTSQDPLKYINGANTYQFELGGPIGTTDPSGTKTTPLIPPPGKSTVGGNVSPQGASIHLGKTFPLGNHFYGGVQVSGHCSWSHGPPGGSVHVGIVYKGNIWKWPIWPWNW